MLRPPPIDQYFVVIQVRPLNLTDNLRRLSNVEVPGIHETDIKWHLKTWDFRWTYLPARLDIGYKCAFNKKKTLDTNHI